MPKEIQKEKSTIDWLRLFRDKLALRVAAKDSWGKYELMDKLDRTYHDVLLEMISQKPEEKK